MACALPEPMNLERGKTKVPVKKKSTKKKAVKKTARKTASKKGMSAGELARTLKKINSRLKNLETLLGTNTPTPTGTID